jgi:hypothetical protein
MYSSVKFLVPSVSVPPDEAALVLALVLLLAAGALAELALEPDLLLPHAAIRTVVSSARTTAVLRGSRCRFLGVGDMLCPPRG